MLTLRYKARMLMDSARLLSSTVCSKPMNLAISQTVASRLLNVSTTGLALINEDILLERIELTVFVELIAPVLALGRLGEHLGNKDWIGHRLFKLGRSR